MSSVALIWAKQTLEIPEYVISAQAHITLIRLAYLGGGRTFSKFKKNGW